MVSLLGLSLHWLEAMDQLAPAQTLLPVQTLLAVGLTSLDLMLVCGMLIVCFSLSSRAA